MPNFRTHINDIKPIRGFVWEGPWQPVVSREESDEEGYQYANSWLLAGSDDFAPIQSSAVKSSIFSFPSSVTEIYFFFPQYYLEFYTTT
jgi:hypothetical protein